MKKIIIATDAWEPQINGVVRCVEELKVNLERKGFEVFIIHPGLFFVLPNTTGQAVFPHPSGSKNSKCKNQN